MKFAILATGGIAHTMAGTVTRMEGVETFAVASRTLSKAQAFAEKWGFKKAYGSYEELAKDPEVDLVYVATPHSRHYEDAKLCLENGKNVLVEKAFTQNAAQAQELVAIARERGLLLAEAIWTRYMPSRKILDDLIEGGAIGRVTSLSANLGYVLGHVERLQSPALAGGALLDLTVYPINFALMVIHEEVVSINASAVMSPAGVDWRNEVTLIFESGRMASLHADMLAGLDREGTVYGDKGFLKVQNINNCEEIRQYDLDHQLVARYEVPEQISGYEYEVEACMRAIRGGQMECPEMPHAETLRVMKLMDEIRACWKTIPGKV